MDFIFGANSLKPNTVKKKKGIPTARTSIVKDPDRIVKFPAIKPCQGKSIKEDPKVNMPINNIIKVAKPAIIKIIQNFAKF
jgi:hypothetical protein